MSLLGSWLPQSLTRRAQRNSLTAQDRSFLARVRLTAGKLRQDSDLQLQAKTADLRSQSVYWQTPTEEAMVRGFALVVTAVQRALGWELYDVQLIGAQRLTQRLIAEMQTGEGKTITCAPAAFMLALSGRGVHVATPNTYLAERDCVQLRPVFNLLGMSVGLLPERVPSSEKRPSYQCDVTYGTGYEFGFDYLRDQLALTPSGERPLGQWTLDAMRSDPNTGSPRAQRRLAYALVDEADHVLLDDATSPLVISGGAAAEAPDKALHLAARRMVDFLQQGIHFHIQSTVGSARLTEEGMDFIHSSQHEIPFEQLRRPWNDYVQQALQAHYCLLRDVHYVVRKEAVEIIDPSSGRIFSDRTWRDGLHQAIQTKEQVKVSAEQSELAQITRQRFYRLYEQVSGMTGTITGCARELHHVYRLGVSTVPRRFPSRRQILPLRVFLNREQKWRAIIEGVAERTSRGQAVLVGANSIMDSLALSDLMRASGIEHQLLNGRQDASEAEIIANAGERGSVTIATNLAGRGTDIRIDPAVSASGGLHVIVSECHLSMRVDQQLVGRCARQNDPGTAQKYACMEDPLLAQYAGWLQKTARRYVNRVGEVTIDLSAQVHRAQQIAERTHYVARCQMLRSDLERESLLASLHR